MVYQGDQNYTQRNKSCKLPVCCKVSPDKSAKLRSINTDQHELHETFPTTEGHANQI